MPAIGGATTQVQFNDAGAFAGDTELTWDKTNDNLTVSYLKLGFNVSLPAGNNVYWRSTNALAATVDVGIARNAAGVLEVNNGDTVGSGFGQYASMKMKNLTTVGDINISNLTSAPKVSISASGGANIPRYVMQIGGVDRYDIISTGDGGIFRIRTFDDAGAFRANAIQVFRADASVAFTGTIYPITDNTVPCGQSGQRWTAVWATNGTIQTSDARQKKDVEDCTLGLQFVQALRPVSYHWIIGDERTHWGMIAQEVQQVAATAGIDFGGCIPGTEKEPAGLNYAEFIAPLIKAVQELSAKVEALEASRS